MTNWDIYVRESYDIVRRAECELTINLAHEVEAYVVHLFAHYLDKPNVNTVPVGVKLLSSVNLPVKAKKELLKTPDKQEYEREKLQAQQTFYLANQWTKIESNLYTQAVYYEPTRLASFYDYESMEYTPEISAALDIYAEESTTVDENCYILQIYSESKRIKSILAD